jgi:hypothetical protein
MKKTLQLHRSTIRTLTAPALAQVVGGAENTQDAGMQSIKVDTKIEPCQRH